MRIGGGMNVGGDGNGGGYEPEREHEPAIADGQAVHCGYCKRALRVAHLPGGDYQVRCLVCGMRAPISGTYYAAVSSALVAILYDVREASR